MTLSMYTLAQTFTGKLYTADDSGYDASRLPFHAAVNPKPVVVALPKTADDVVTAVRFAKANSLSVGVQVTGHGTIRPSDDGLLLNMTHMKSVNINAVTRTARIETGAVWEEVLSLADEHDLAPITGTYGKVGVAGFSLGGGLGWLSRQYGFAADSIIEAEMVTAKGELITVTEKSHPDLLWGLRGGSGNFGVVTALTIALHPVADVYAGTGFYDAVDAADVLRAFRDWVPQLPHEMTAMLVHVNLPPIPQIPEAVRGKKVVGLKIFYNGSAGEAQRYLTDFYNLAGEPLTHDFAVTRYADFIASGPSLSPTASMDTVALFDRLDDETIETLAANMQPAAPFRPVMEVRHWGGALDRPAAGHLMNYKEVGLSVYATVATKELAEPSREQFLRLKSDLRTQALDRTFLNFDSDPSRTKLAFLPDSYRRLSELKMTYDPTNMFRFNHTISPK